jgi:hypothetical protein
MIDARILVKIELKRTLWKHAEGHGIECTSLGLEHMWAYSTRQRSFSTLDWKFRKGKSCPSPTWTSSDFSRIPRASRVLLIPMNMPLTI